MFQAVNWSAPTALLRVNFRGSDGEEITETCSKGANDPEYAWKKLGADVAKDINTLLFVSGWRHSIERDTYSDEYPYLNIAITADEPTATNVGSVAWISDLESGAGCEKI